MIWRVTVIEDDGATASLLVTFPGTVERDDVLAFAKVAYPLIRATDATPFEGDIRYVRRAC